MIKQTLLNLCKPLSYDRFAPKLGLKGSKRKWSGGQKLENDGLFYLIAYLRVGYRLHTNDAVHNFVYFGYCGSHK